MPMRAGTGEQGVFEHVDRRAELPPEDGPPQRVHLYTSKCHSAYSSRSRKNVMVRSQARRAAPASYSGRFSSKNQCVVPGYVWTVTGLPAAWSSCSIWATDSDGSKG